MAVSSQEAEITVQDVLKSKWRLFTLCWQCILTQSCKILWWNDAKHGLSSHAWCACTHVHRFCMWAERGVRIPIVDESSRSLPKCMGFLRTFLVWMCRDHIHAQESLASITGVALVCVSSCYALYVRILFSCIPGFEDMVFSKLGGRLLLKTTVHGQHREHAMLRYIVHTPLLLYCKSHETPMSL